MSHLNDSSFWFEQLAENILPRASLCDDIQADVVIIGAGYTGLWTAYYLKKYQPQLSVVILESTTAGFGAAGRNGGWLIGGIAGELKQLAVLEGAEQKAARGLLTGIVDEVAEVIRLQGIECDLHRGGSIAVAARYKYQTTLLRQELADYHCAGFSDEDYRWLDQTELEQHVRMYKGTGAIFTKHCASLNPGKLVRGLARCVEEMGVKIYETSRVTHIQPNIVSTKLGSVCADVIVPATEGFAEKLLGLNRYILPIQSLLIATTPLNEQQWQEIGLEQRPTFSDGGRLTTYGQRSLDQRLIFGARGGYQFGGKAQSQFSLKDPAFRLREYLLHQLFPSIKNVEITHGWGGTLGMARKFTPFALFDSTSGIACAGGYGGEGVGASNLFARTLVDLILQRETLLPQMPWAYSDNTMAKTLKKWEPEPLRWLTYQTILNTFAWEDKVHSRQGSAELTRQLSSALSGQLEKIMV